MLSYWILRDPSDTPVGLVRLEDDRVLLKPTAAADAEYRLFSDGEDIPIAPFSEVRLKNAEALIGLSDGTPCAFAAAPDAKPLSAYLARLSQIRTMQTEPIPVQTVPEPTEAMTETVRETTLPEIEGTEILPDVSDTAREAEAFALLLRRANDFFARFAQIHPPSVDNLVQNEDNQEETERGIDLFPAVFPGARWRYVDGANLVGHYEGIYRYPNGERMQILAVRGRCAPRPPRTLMGFTRYLRAADGSGYWLRLTPLSPDGAESR